MLTALALLVGAAAPVALYATSDRVQDWTLRRIAALDSPTLLAIALGLAFLVARDDVGHRRASCTCTRGAR